MTPLANMIVKHVFVRPLTDFHSVDGKDAMLGAALQLLASQIFDCSKVIGLADEFAQQHYPHHIDNKLMFLPSDYCWFEWVDGRGARHAIDVCKSYRSEGEVAARFVHFDLNPERGMLGLSPPPPRPGFVFGKTHHFSLDAAANWAGAPILAGLLTIVNQPSGIERARREVNTKTARAVFRKLGKVELRPWHILKIGGPVGTGTGGGHSSGRKCYHFVRAHFRQANGQFVRAHFRGDPALGIGRKTYEVHGA